MKLKSKWSYCYQKGLKGAMVSEDYHIIGDKIYFVLCLGMTSFDSLLIELDLVTNEARVVYEEKHVLRSVGAYEDGKFYFTSMKGNAYCVDLTGNVLWSVDLGTTNASFKVALDGDRLYVSDYTIFCLDKNTGNIIWKSEEYREKVNCNIAVDEKNIYCGELGGKVFCLDKLTGEKRWEYGEEEWISNCMLLENDNVLVLHIHGRFYFINAKDGSLKESIEAHGMLYKTPVLADGRLYVGDQDSVMNSISGNMTCYELGAGNSITECFSINVSGGVSSSALIEGDMLLFASKDNYLYCVDKNTGEEIMPRKKVKGECRNIIVRNNELIVLSDKGQVECFSIF